MIQTVIAMLVVAAAVVMAVRRAVRALRGHGDCHCDGCPLGGQGACHSCHATMPKHDKKG